MQIPFRIDLSDFFTLFILSKVANIVLANFVDSGHMLVYKVRGEGTTTSMYVAKRYSLWDSDLEKKFRWRRMEIFLEDTTIFIRYNPNPTDIYFDRIRVFSVEN